MGDTFIVARLREKCARIAGIIADHEKKIADWRNALRHLRRDNPAVRRRAGPGVHPEVQTYRPSETFYGATLARLCLDQPRQAQTPISAPDIHRTAIEAHGLDNDVRTRTATVERVLRYLRQKQARGHVQRHAIGTDVRWSLKDAGAA